MINDKNLTMEIFMRVYQIQQQNKIDSIMRVSAPQVKEEVN